MKEFVVIALSAAVGWGTNWLAIKGIFRPRKKWFAFHGLLVKNKKDYAESLSKVIIERFLAEGLESQFPGLKIYEVTDKIAEDLALAMTEEAGISYNEKVKAALRDLMSDFMRDSIKDKIPEKTDTIEKLKLVLAENIEKTSDDEIEKLIYEISSKEFRFIELVGLVVGAIGGCISVGVNHYW